MPFQELTGTQFAELVENEEKHRSETYTIMFRADWCGHCARALPEYKLAAKHSTNKWYSVEETQFNKYLEYLDMKNQIHHTNEAPFIVIAGYPTFIHHPANLRKGQPFLKYSGARDAESLFTAFETRHRTGTNNA
jgi:thiol-disulfide isomerase/thioredoxin